MTYDREEGLDVHAQGVGDNFAGQQRAVGVGKEAARVRVLLQVVFYSRQRDGAQLQQRRRLRRHGAQHARCKRHTITTGTTIKI